MALRRCRQYLDRANCLRMMTPATPTLTSLADYLRPVANGCVLNWSTADGTAENIFYLAFADRVSLHLRGGSLRGGSLR